MFLFFPVLVKYDMICIMSQLETKGGQRLSPVFSSLNIINSSYLLILYYIFIIILSPYTVGYISNIYFFRISYEYRMATSLSLSRKYVIIGQTNHISIASTSNAAFIFSEKKNL